MESHIETPLEVALANADRPQATPLSVFKMARTNWLEGKRISIGELAKEAGVSRVTLYRWVGSKDRLTEEVLWSFAKPTFENAIKGSPGNGVEHIVGVHHQFLTDLANFIPFRRFVIENPTVAISIQTNDPKSAHGRLMRVVEAHLKAQQSQGHIKLHSPARKIAEMIVFTNGALLYSAIIGDRASTAIEHACALIRMTLLDQIPDAH